MNAEDKLLKIIKHYGLRNQLRKLNEETYELIEAAIYDHNQHDIYTIEHITEEIADVTVLLEQIRLFYNIPEKDVIKIKWEKVERQLERIKKDYNLGGND